MIGEGLAEPTIRKRCGIAKQIFSFAKKKGLIEANPFVELKSAVMGNPDRFHFVSVEETQAVLDACPNAEWRLIIALARYGGLRCPSEHLALKWEDVLWDQNKMLVTSPKTEHHEGKASRWVPLFPELRLYLEASFELAEAGAEFVIVQNRDKKNWRTPFMKILKRAGLTPWPKPFQNLRSTRQTELEELFPSHVVCAWIGNSQAVARKHYLQVTEDHFAQAVERGALMVQNQVQHTAAGNRDKRQSKRKTPMVAGVTPNLAKSRDCL